MAGGTDEVRLAGINAPEATECQGAGAARALERLVAGADVTLVASAGDEDRDRFGRLLRHVFVAGVDVNATMVAEGHALALHTDRPGSAQLVRLADAAWQDRLGMWAEDACGPASGASISVFDIAYDPSGPDEKNLDREIVSMAAETTTDLGGWTLRDESSTNRFVFPAGFVVEAGSTFTLHTGCGEPTATELHWCSERPVWSNGGDTAILQDSFGNVVSRLGYEG